MIEINDNSDSDNDDVFVLKQIKPVCTLTKERALQIKNELIGESDGDIAIIEEINVKTKCSVTSENKDKDTASSKKIKNSAQTQTENVATNDKKVKRKRKSEEPKKINNLLTPRNKRKSSVSPDKTIKDYFTPTKNSPNGKTSSWEKSNTPPGSSSKKIKLSPSILKRAKRFNLDLEKIGKETSELNGKAKSLSPKKSPNKSLEFKTINSEPSTSRIKNEVPERVSPNKSPEDQNIINETINSVPSTSTTKNEMPDRISPNKSSVDQNIMAILSAAKIEDELVKKNRLSKNNLGVNNLIDSNSANHLPGTSKSPLSKANSKTPPKEKRVSDAGGAKIYPNENSKLNCELFRKVLHDEMQKQLQLEKQSIGNGDKNFERLLSLEDLSIIDRFFKLDITAQQLFVRMYSRVHKDNWYRLCNIKYDDINNIEGGYDILRDSGFFEVNVEDTSMVEQLNLLRKPEIHYLCKGFNLNMNLLSNAKKEVLIEKLIEDNKKQKSVLDMMSSSRSKTASRLELLKAEIKKALGSCFKLNEKVVQTFNRIVLLYSLVFHFDDETNRVQGTLYLLFQVHVGQLKYLDYKVDPTVIFKTKKDFLKYEKALQLWQKMESALNAKNFESFDAVAKEARREFEELLKDEEYLKRFEELKPFLKRYSAGSVYSRILTTYCDKFKTRKDKKDVIEIGCLLLNQNYFGLSKKGHWYEITTQAYEASKCTELAGKLLIVALKDEYISEIMKLTLQLRGKALLRRKTNAIVDQKLKDYLEDACTTCVPEPLTREISARALEGCAGFKSVYVIEGQNGTSYSSVEEQALYHYKREDGFEQGIHVEGMVIHSIYFLLFFDVIYSKTSPPGVFQSPYQETPLDFASSSFYKSREQEIESRLEEINFWTFDDILQKMSLVYSENFNTNCCISWKEEFNPELFCDIIKCMGIEPLKAICRRLVKNYRVFRSGFPDLTLWSTTTRKIKFVEVKSPNDRLSPNQRIWLNFLKSIGLECEVCNVKNVGGKKFRS